MRDCRYSAYVQAKVDARHKEIKAKKKNKGRKRAVWWEDTLRSNF